MGLRIDFWLSFAAGESALDPVERAGRAVRTARAPAPAPDPNSRKIKE